VFQLLILVNAMGRSYGLVPGCCGPIIPHFLVPSSPLTFPFTFTHPLRVFLELKGISWSAAIGLLLWAVVAHAEPARWFMPGPLGYEPGSAPPPPAKDAFLTRAMDIGGTEEEKAWSEKNLLTPSLAFSHNLAAIVRKEDYATHPEWFPLVAGQRYRPPEQIVNWNPDLASEAVVQRAAQARAPHSKPIASASHFPSESTTRSSTASRRKCCPG